MKAQYRITLISLIASILFSSCDGYDLSTKQIAFLTNSTYNLYVSEDSTYTLYVSEANGSNRITLAKNVRSFRWLSESNEIECIKESLNKDTVLSKFSIYRTPMADPHNFYRVSEATGDDTVFASRTVYEQHMEKQGATFLYSIRNDSLFVRIAAKDTQEVLIFPEVLSYSLNQ